MLADDLNNAITAVCPIVSLRIGNLADRSTWQIEFDPSATDAQKQAAQNVINTFTITDSSETTVASMLSNGLTITSTGTPALNGTYPVRQEQRTLLQAIALYISINNKFPAGRTKLPWLDKFNGVHVFNDTATFLAFYGAVVDFCIALEICAHQTSPAFPISSVTII